MMRLTKAVDMNTKLVSCDKVAEVTKLGATYATVLVIYVSRY